MDRKRRKINHRRFHGRSRHPHNNDESTPGPSSCRGRPRNLTGKEIGMYYKQKYIETISRPLGTILLAEDKKSEIQKLLRKIRFSENDNKIAIKKDDSDYNYIADSAFKSEFLKLINGSIEQKLNDSSIKKSLERDERLDELYLNKFTAKNLQNILPIREKLPSFQKRNEIIHLINNNQVIVISGETGCGKTTQVAQYILDDFISNKNGSLCKIICTQPRRISAISIAERVAYERGEKCGEESVGFQIRLEKKLPRETGSIVFCTTGVLLRQMESDPFLSKISHLILDEIHERDVISDFIITLVKQIICKRPDLKLILMSATLNAKQFCDYFNNCKIIEIPGFTYPVTTYYLEDVLSKIDFEFPLSKEINGWRKYIKKNKLMYKAENDFRDFIEPYVRNLRMQKKFSRQVCDNLANPQSEELNLDLILKLLKHICTNEPDGSILIFVPGFSDISKLSTLIKNDNFPEHKYLIVLLHSKLPSLQQKKVFERPPPGIKKIVIATNIAETSITIDDIIYVIDCGKIKMTTYDVENDLESLKPQWVSIANANQRRGRAGRVQPGVCYHLFTKVRQNCLESYLQPEILRCRLENIILKVKILQLGNTFEFFNKLMDPPHKQAVENALRLLKQMNAIDSDEKLTPLGYHLARLPVNPKMGKMILLGALFSCLDPITSIAASLDFKDAFYIPIDKQKEVEAKKRELLSGWKSDHLLLAEALRQYEEAKYHGNERQFCWEYFLSSSTLELLINMKSQFAEYLYDMKFLTNNNVKSREWNENSHNLSLIKAIVCASLYPNVALLRKITKNYKVIKTIENEGVKLHLNSVNCHEETFESPILIYNLKLKSSAIFLHDTSMVHPLPLLFFGDEIKIEDINDNTIISLSKILRFKCKRDTAIMIKQLRSELDELLQYKICHPGIVNWRETNAQVSVLRAIMELITSEDMGEIDYEEYEY